MPLVLGTAGRADDHATVRRDSFSASPLRPVLPDPDAARTALARVQTGQVRDRAAALAQHAATEHGVRAAATALEERAE